MEFDGYDNVLGWGVDHTQTHTGTHQRTEGVATCHDNTCPDAVVNWGNFVELDLYIDPAWENMPVRAGLWVVGGDEEGAPISGGRVGGFGIIEFTTAGVNGSGDIVKSPRWRIWSSIGGGFWLDVPFLPNSFGEWVRLGIELDPVAGQYRFYFNDAPAFAMNTDAGNPEFIREVFLNSYNYGLEEFGSGICYEYRCR